MQITLNIPEELAAQIIHEGKDPAQATSKPLPSKATALSVPPSPRSASCSATKSAWKSTPPQRIRGLSPLPLDNLKQNEETSRLIHEQQANNFLPQCYPSQAHMNLITHLATHFPTLTLEPPLFYRWPTGLRFELNAELPNIPYFDTVYHRAITLYESAFAPEDSALVATANGRFRGVGRQRTSGGQGLFDLAKRMNLGIGRPSGRYTLKRDPEYANTDDAEYIKIRWAEISPRRIDYAAILRGIAHTDFPYIRFKPHRGHFPTSDRIFFINLSRNLIFHMYDDRGLDIVAPTRSTLEPLYETHNSWLFDYDIKRMNATFKT